MAEQNVGPQDVNYACQQTFHRGHDSYCVLHVCQSACVSYVKEETGKG
jgi:hypothetical protein